VRTSIPDPENYARELIIQRLLKDPRIQEAGRLDKATGLRQIREAMIDLAPDVPQTADEDEASSLALQIALRVWDRLHK
jgi:hypothetical protein